MSNPKPCSCHASRLISISHIFPPFSLCWTALVWQTLEASSKFSNLFKDGKVKKEYLAICHGDPGRDTLVDAPLYRRSSGKVAAVRKEEAEQYGARETITRIRNVATIGGMYRVGITASKSTLSLLSCVAHRLRQVGESTTFCVCACYREWFIGRCSWRASFLVV